MKALRVSTSSERHVKDDVVENRVLVKEVSERFKIIINGDYGVQEAFTGHSVVELLERKSEGGYNQI